MHIGWDDGLILQYIVVGVWYLGVSGRSIRNHEFLVESKDYIFTNIVQLVTVTQLMTNGNLLSIVYLHWYLAKPNCTIDVYSSLREDF